MRTFLLGMNKAMKRIVNPVRHVLAVYRDGTCYKTALVDADGVILQVNSSHSIKEPYPSQKERRHVVTGIEGKKVLIRSFRSPLPPGKALKKTLPFLLEEQISFPLQEALICPIYRNEEKGTKITCLITLLSTFVNHVADVPCNPAYVSSSLTALARFATHALPSPPERYAVCHIGEEETEIIAIEAGVPYTNTSLSGGNRIFRNNDTDPLIREKYLHDVGKAFFRLCNGEDKQKSLPLLFTGEQKPQYAIEKRLLFLEIPFSKLHLRPPYDDAMQSYAIPIGLAQEMWAQDNLCVQFRNGDIPSQAKTGPALRYLACSILGCFGTFALILGVGSNLIGKKEDKLIKSIDEFTMLRKHRLTSPNKILQTTDIREKLTLLEREARNLHKRTLPTSLSVSSVLSRLLPSLSIEKGEGIRIEKLQYALTNYQEVAQSGASNGRVPYRVRLELDLFSLTEARIQALLDTVRSWREVQIDQEKVTRNREENVYRLSFILSG